MYGVESINRDCKPDGMAEMEKSQDSKTMFSEKLQHRQRGQEKWLSGAELLWKTGISKTDLIKFIRLGVLPKSKMRVSLDRADGNRKIRYFSTSILSQVRRLRHLRDKGYSAGAIATEWQKADKRPQGKGAHTDMPVGASPHIDRLLDVDALRVRLPGESAMTSAFFLNKSLRIVWIEPGQDDRLVGAISSEMNNDPDGTVFSVLLRIILKDRIANWQPILTFIHAFLRRTTSPEIFKILAPKISIGLKNLDQAKALDDGNKGVVTIDSCPLNLEDDPAGEKHRRIYGIALSEGTLFVVDKDRWPPGGIPDRSRESKPEQRSGSSPVCRKVPFSVLSARLEGSQNMADALLPKIYFQIVTMVWDEIDQLVTSHGGHRVKRGGNETQYIIPSHSGSKVDPAFIAIRCAVDIRLKIKGIETSLKTSRKWVDALRLNIGISSGRDYMREGDPTACMALILPGGASDQADHLSAVSHGGAIWVAKSAFSHLTQQQVDQIKFGVFQDDKLIPNIFTSVTNCSKTNVASQTNRSIRPLSATCIIDLESSS